jgi:hypothetical protein
MSLGSLLYIIGLVLGLGFDFGSAPFVIQCLIRLLLLLSLFLEHD